MGRTVYQEATVSQRGISRERGPMPVWATGQIWATGLSTSEEADGLHEQRTTAAEGADAEVPGA